MDGLFCPVWASCLVYTCQLEEGPSAAVGMRLLVGGIPLGGAGDKAQGLVLIGGCGTEPLL